MIIAVLVVLGLALGSFVNALVWRLHEQDKQAKKAKSEAKSEAKPDADRNLSIAYGRSQCPNCRHQLAAKDLLPVLSWLWLQGRCRYCQRPISPQYPLVELATAALFAASYIWWPEPLRGGQVLLFGLWLPILVVFMALIVYDLRWMLLPNRLMRPANYLSIAWAIVVISLAARPMTALLNIGLAVAIGGGLFYVLYQVSNGRWIGGGDVRLGWVLGLIVTTPGRAILFILLASLLGTLVSLPALALKRLNKKSLIPFGPFLIMATILVVLFGHDMLLWYQRTFFPFTT